MRNIFTAPCGKFHMVEDGSPLQHDCKNYAPPSDPPRATARRSNPVPEPLHARVEDDDGDGEVSEDDFEEIARSPEMLRREVRNNPISDKDMRAMERDRSSFQPSRPASRDGRPSAPEEARPWRPSAQPPPRPARRANPSDCDCSHAANPVAEPSRSTSFAERRCNMLRARHQIASKGRGDNLSCRELERLEGPAFDRMLSDNFNQLPLEKQQDILRKFPELDYLKSKRFGSNPVESTSSAHEPHRTVAERRCDMIQARYRLEHKTQDAPSCRELERTEGRAFDEMLRKNFAQLPPEAQQKFLREHPELNSILSKRFASNPVPEEIANPPRKASPSVAAPRPAAPSSTNETWRNRALPMTDGMRSVLANLSIPGGYKYLTRLKKERNKRASLAMIDFALQDLSNWKPTDQDARQFSTALTKDLRGLRARWKEFATIHNDGLDDAVYPINEATVKV